MEAWFSKGLIAWYNRSKRDLPWRNETDPYKIWLSEVILQQTQVAQGLSYYLKFTKSFPKLKDLALASEDKILNLWQGLGYYSRARNLHAASKTILAEYKGIFPKNYEDIRKLKGVGDYTAAAIASFSYNLPHAVVDGNVYRLLSRVFGIQEAIDTTAGKKKFQQLANELLNTKQPGIYNQAIMEFGSQYCKPANPDCPNCIFNSKCFAFQQNQVQTLPLKSKKSKIRKRYFNYVLQSDIKGNLKIYKRSENDIWKGLYEFYLIESKTEISLKELIKHQKYQLDIDKNSKLIFTSKKFKHVLSHQHLYARFYIVQSPKPFSSKQRQLRSNKTFYLIQEEDLNNYAFSRLTLKFLESCILKEIL